MKTLIKTLSITLAVFCQTAFSQCVPEKQTVNIEARIYEDKSVCRRGIPVVVLAPSKIQESRFNAAILTISSEKYYFQSNLKFVSKVDDISDGVFFCSNKTQLSDISIRFLYGSSGCKGYMYRYEVDGFERVLDGSAVSVSEE